MLILVIDAMIGLITAIILASLLHSARAFGPAYRRLRAEVARAEAQQDLRVTFRDIGEPLPRPVACRPGLATETAKPQRIMPPALTGWSAAA